MQPANLVNHEIFTTPCKTTTVTGEELEEVVAEMVVERVTEQLPQRLPRPADNPDPDHSNKMPDIITVRT